MKTHLQASKSKERMTMLVCCNPTGQHKLLLVLPGKSAKPMLTHFLHYLFHIKLKEMSGWTVTYSNKGFL